MLNIHEATELLLGSMLRYFEVPIAHNWLLYTRAMKLYEEVVKQ